MSTARLLRSSSLRIALLYGFAFIAAVVVLLVFIYVTTVGYMDRQLDTILRSEMQGLIRQFDRDGAGGLARIIDELVAQHPDGEVVYLLIDNNQNALAGNLDQWPDRSVGDEGWADFLLDEWDFEKETRPARVLAATLPGDFRVLIGRDVGDRNHVQRLILDALMWALAMTVFFALGIGVLVSSRVTGRLERLNRTARRIMQGDLDQRVPIDGSNDDFDQLAVNLNNMLDRIQALMTTVQEISNNVAHDLRKPLTHLQHRLEEAHRAEPAEAKESLQKATLEADELMATFNALLRIARIESGSRRSAFEAVDVSTLLADVGEFYEPVATECNKSMGVESQPGLVVQADRNLLFQALVNLVDNAIKYTPEGGQIQLLASGENDSVTVSISDTGPGIPPELREKVFQRFYRVDDSRSTPGNGLGLSLVQAVAELHDADIRLEDNSPGLRIEFVLNRE